MSKLTDGSFWADTLSRAGRQALQAAIPVLLVVASGDVTGLSLADSAIVIAVAALVTVAKALAGLTAGDGASLPVRIAERAVAAFAGVVAGGLYVTSVAEFAALDWSALLYAAVGAAGLSVAQLFVDPPAPASSYAA